MRQVFKKWSIILCLVMVFATIITVPVASAEIRYLPIRSTFEGIGFTVSWIAEERAITLEKGLLFVKLKNGSAMAWINGHYEKLMLQVKVINGVSYTDESLLALLYGQGYTFVSGKVVLKTDARPNEKYSLPVVGTEARLRELFPSFGNQMDYRYNDVMIELQPTMEAASEKIEGDFSETNVQEQGIDEADITKTDGRYIYTVKAGNLVIIDTAEGGLVKKATISENDTYFQELFIEGTQLIGIGTLQQPRIKSEEMDNRYWIMPIFETETVVNIYDLQTINAPKRIKSYVLKGRALASRLMDNSLYMVLNQDSFYGDLPYPTLRVDEGEEITFGPERIHYFPNIRPDGMMMTFAIALDHLKEAPDVDVYLSAGQTVYMSPEHLYVAQDIYPDYMVKTETEREKTAITQFSLEPGHIVFNRTKAVEGRLLNQWAMDEHNGHLRLAINTSIGYIGDDSTISRIDIYSETLEPIGQTEALAKGERIYAVRFIDDLAYLVTFKQIDPFFAIDCSVPEKPVVLGYLKIPGYSQYLHPLSDTKILGVGHQTKETEFGVRNDGLKFSIFDTADMQNIRELDNMVLGSGSASSESLYDHKAFMIHLGKRLFAVPVSLYSEYGGQQDAFIGTYIIKYTADYALEVLGTIQHQSTEYGGMESIRRILYIGNTLYTVSENKIGAYDIDTLKVITQLTF